MTPATDRRAGDDSHASGAARLQRQLVVVLERTDLDGLHAAQPEQQQDRLLEPLVDDDLTARVDLGDARFAVEQTDGVVDPLIGVGVVQVELVAPCPEVIDRRLQIGHDR